MIISMIAYQKFVELIEAEEKAADGDGGYLKGNRWVESAQDMFQRIISSKTMYDERDIYTFITNEMSRRENLLAINDTFRREEIHPNSDVAATGSQEIFRMAKAMLEHDWDEIWCGFYVGKHSDEANDRLMAYAIITAALIAECQEENFDPLDFAYEAIRITDNLALSLSRLVF